MSGFVVDFGVPNAGQSGVTATGSTLATAYVLTKSVTVFSAVPVGTGAALPSSYASGVSLTICNRDPANDLLVYPAGGDKIEAGSASAPITVPAGGNVTLISFAPPVSVPPRTWYQTESYSVGGYLPLAGGTMTGPLTFDTWNTAGRPSVPSTGTTGWNTTLGYLESWSGAAWVTSTGTGFYLPLAGGTMTGTLGEAKTTTWAGASFPGTNNLANYSTQTYAGTPIAGFSDTSGTVIPMNLWYVSSDQMVWTGPVNAFEFKHQYGGGSTSGGRHTMLVDSNVTGALANTANNNFVGFQLFQTVGANVTGAAAGSGNGLGSFFAMSLQYGRLSSGVFAHEVNAWEIDYTPGAGSSTDYGYGLKFVNFAPAAYHANIFECALNFGTSNPGTTGTWNKIIWFGDPQSSGGAGFPCTATGILIGSYAGTVATAVDFSALTATNLMKGPASFAIDGSAYVHSPGIVPATGLTTGFYSAGHVPMLAATTVATPVNYFSVTNAATGSAPILATAGSDATVGMNFQTATGNGDFLFLNSSAQREFKVTGVAAVISYGVMTPAAAGNVLFDVGGTATGISIGRTAATGIAIGNASANTVVGGGSALATNATAGMILIPSCAGAPTGNVGALGQVALIYDSTNSKFYVGVAGTWKGVVVA